MNQTQKRFTINEVILSLNAAAGDICKKEDAEIKNINEKFKFDINKFISGVASGKIKLLGKTKFKEMVLEDSKNTSYHAKRIQEFFDVPNLDKQKKAALKKIGHTKSFTLTLSNPLGVANDAKYHHIASLDKNIQRLKNIEDKFKELIQQIMLGDSDYALNLLEQLKKIKF